MSALVEAPHPIAAETEVQPPPAERPPEAEKDPEIGAMGVLDAHLLLEFCGLAIVIKGGVLIHRAEVVAATDLRAEYQSPVAEGPLGVGADREVIGVDPRLGHIARGRFGGKSFLGENQRIIVPTGGNAETIPTAGAGPLETEAEPMGGLLRVEDPPDLRVRGRFPDIARLIGAPPQVDDAAEGGRLPTGPETLHCRSRIKDRVLRAPIVAIVAVVGAEEDAATKQARGELGGGPQLVEAGAANGAPPETRGPLRIGHAGPRPYDSAEGIGAVGHGTRPPHHLDLLNGLGVEIGGRRSGAALGAHAAVIEEEQGTVLGQSANARHRRVSVAAGAGARDVLQRLEELSRKALTEIPAAHHRRRHRRRQLEVRHHPAHHRHGLAHRRHLDHQRPIARDHRHCDRAQGHSVGAGDEEHEWRIRRGVESEEPVRIGHQAISPTYHGDPRTCERHSVRCYEAAFEGRHGGCHAEENRHNDRDSSLDQCQ